MAKLDTSFKRRADSWLLLSGPCLAMFNQYIVLIFNTESENGSKPQSQIVYCPTFPWYWAGVWERDRRPPSALLPCYSLLLPSQWGKSSGVIVGIVLKKQFLRSWPHCRKWSKILLQKIIIWRGEEILFSSPSRKLRVQTNCLFFQWQAESLLGHCKHSMLLTPSWFVCTRVHHYTLPTIS